MDTVGSYETLVPIYQTICHCISEDSNVNILFIYVFLIFFFIPKYELNQIIILYSISKILSLHHGLFSLHCLKTQNYKPKNVTRISKLMMYAKPEKG
jgi:hypothetical protein